MSAYETIGSTTKRRDVVYANGEAIAEIDQDDKIYELHNDHLGTPRYITAGNAMANVARGQIAGQQAFGPYGEEIINATVPSGYKPLTGYTGHLNEDMTGLIYMKGRYYSPLWHRFINSDQGVDPNSINQFAYVGGRPFMATDPSGMRSCVTFTMAVPDSSYDDSYSNGTVVLAYKLIEIEFCYGGRSGVAEDMPGGGVGGGGGGGGGGGSDKFAQMQKRAQKEQQDKPPCNPTITSGTGVTNSDRNLFTNAVNLLNSSSLTSNQRSVLGHIKGIQLGNAGVSFARVLTGTFVVNVNEYRGQSVAWTATQIAHESFHMYRSNNNLYTGLPSVAEEIAAVNFQLGVGQRIGLEPFYVNHLNNYKNRPSAIENRIDAAAACR